MHGFMEDSLDIPVRDVLKTIQHRIMNQTTYFGVKTLKNPLDFWVYREIICERRPTVIIEIGNASGGSTLALAHIFDLLEEGRVIGLDVTHAKIPQQVRDHPRITLIEGDACESYEEVLKILSGDDRVMVIEDSSHSYENTLRVLRTFSPLIDPGGYFIVEDSICHHGLDVGPIPGPYEAIETFTGENTDFLSDRTRESFFITWNPKGFLKRVN